MVETLKSEDFLSDSDQELILQIIFKQIIKGIFMFDKVILTTVLSWAVTFLKIKIPISLSVNKYSLPQGLNFTNLMLIVVFYILSSTPYALYKPNIMQLMTL